MSTWKHLDDRPKRTLDIDEAAAVEHVLDVAAAWQQGDIALNAALSEGGGINPHTARTLAFHFAGSDERIPALRHLSEVMSGAFKVRLSDGTFMERDQWSTNERQVAAWKRSRETYRGDDQWTAA